MIENNGFIIYKILYNKMMYQSQIITSKKYFILVELSWLASHSIKDLTDLHVILIFFINCLAIDPFLGVICPGFHVGVVPSQSATIAL